MPTSSRPQRLFLRLIDNSPSMFNGCRVFDDKVGRYAPIDGRKVVNHGG